MGEWEGQGSVLYESLNCSLRRACSVQGRGGVGGRGGARKSKITLPLTLWRKPPSALGFTEGGPLGAKSLGFVTGRWSPE